MQFYFLADRNRAKRIADGKCQRCCKPRGASRAKTLCESCADKERDKSKQRRIEQALRS